METYTVKIWVKTGDFWKQILLERMGNPSNLAGNRGLMRAQVSATNRKNVVSPLMENASESNMRSEYLANLEMSRVHTRHATQQVARQRMHPKGKGSMSLCLMLAAFVGMLLSFAV